MILETNFNPAEQRINTQSDCQGPTHCSGWMVLLVTTLRKERIWRKQFSWKMNVECLNERLHKYVLWWMVICNHPEKREHFRKTIFFKDECWMFMKGCINMYSGKKRLTINLHIFTQPHIFLFLRHHVDTRIYLCSVSNQIQCQVDDM